MTSPRKNPFEGPERPPHPAIVARPAGAVQPRSPHPATVAQQRRIPGGAPPRPPHAATLSLSARNAAPGLSVQRSAAATSGPIGISDAIGPILKAVHEIVQNPKAALASGLDGGWEAWFQIELSLSLQTATKSWIEVTREATGAYAATAKRTDASATGTTTTAYVLPWAMEIKCQSAARTTAAFRALIVADLVKLTQVANLSTMPIGVFVARDAATAAAMKAITGLTHVKSQLLAGPTLVALIVWFPNADNRAKLVFS